MHKVITSVASVISACVRTIGTCLRSVAAFPFKALGGIMGGGAASAASSEARAAAQGQAAIGERDAAAERDAMWVEQLESLKMVAAAIACGRPPAEADVAALTQPMLKYAASLSHAEAKIVAGASITKLKAHCKGSARIPALPAFQAADGKHETSTAAPAPALNSKAARAIELKAALRRGPQPVLSRTA